MYLSSVEVKNFRSLSNIKATFKSGLNVLVGRNNTGKTNLLQAIRLAIGPNGSRGESLWLDRDDFYKSSNNDDSEREIEITLIYSDLSDSQRSKFYEIMEFDLDDLQKSRAIIRFKASWQKNKRRPIFKRTGGPSAVDPPEVPSEILTSIPITFLPALRNAEEALTPGYRNRLAQLLRDLAERPESSAKDEIEQIFSKANQELEKQNLIEKTRNSLQSTTRDIAGTDYVASSIKTSEVNFDKILRTLQIQMDGVPIGGLQSNGLGYNNLLYIAVVLQHLKNCDPSEFPMFLVEEPEAHLHPQLTILLANYLATNTPGSNIPQTIVTTHSPTLVAHVPPSRIHVLYSKQTDGKLNCNSITCANMDEKEEHSFQRMMDITRSTLYFSKGAILVEGITESLLIPILAKRLGLDLSALHISVIPICGVAFRTFEKVLSPKVLGIPVSIITDADPPINRGNTWKEDTPEPDGSKYKVSDRTTKLYEKFKNHGSVKVFSSELTLEYDLAKTDPDNLVVMIKAWKECFVGTQRTMSDDDFSNPDISHDDKALMMWRGICRSSNSNRKAEFAHQLVEVLDQKSNGAYIHRFESPQYIKEAIEYVVKQLGNMVDSAD